MSNDPTLLGIIGLVVGITILNEIMETVGCDDNLHAELLNRIGGC